MSGKKRLTEEDIVELYDLATSQLREDRESVNNLFDELREYVRGHQTRYVELGEVLAKLADLKMKQTGQVVEVFKTIEKAIPKEDFGSLSVSDMEFINDQIQKKKGKKE